MRCLRLLSALCVAISMAGCGGGGGGGGSYTVEFLGGPLPPEYGYYYRVQVTRDGRVVPFADIDLHSTTNLIQLVSPDDAFYSLRSEDVPGKLTVSVTATGEVLYDKEFVIGAQNTFRVQAQVLDEHGTPFVRQPIKFLFPGQFSPDFAFSHNTSDIGTFDMRLPQSVTSMQIDPLSYQRILFDGHFYTKQPHKSFIEIPIPKGAPGSAQQYLIKLYES